MFYADAIFMDNVQLNESKMMSLLDKIVYHRKSLADPKSFFLALASRAPRRFWLSEPELQALCDSETISFQPLSGLSESAVTDRIPKVIFQTWKSRTIIPLNYRYWRSTISSRHPDWQVLLWDDFDNRAFVERFFPWLLGRYSRYPREIFRVDLVRILFLYMYGGFYLDMDVECQDSLERYSHLSGVVLGRMGSDRSFEHSIPNAMMASTPHQIFWLLALTLAIERLDAVDEAVLGSSKPEWLTGPVLMRDAVLLYEVMSPQELWKRCAQVLKKIDSLPEARYGKITLLPSEEWYPVNWDNPLHQMFRDRMIKDHVVPSPQLVRKTLKNATLVTYWTHSW